MLDYELQGKLIIFLRALEKVETTAGFDLGLILKEKETKTQEILDLAPKGIIQDFNIIEINSQLHPDEIIEKIREGYQKNIPWIFLDFKEIYFPAHLYNQLRILSCQNMIGDLNVFGNKTRIILVVNKSDLAKIKIPTFLNLFGPILNI